jgi:hypothetical protein
MYQLFARLKSRTLRNPEADHSTIIKSLLVLFFGKEESSFLKERSKELFFLSTHDGPTRPARQIAGLSGTQGVEQ